MSAAFSSPLEVVVLVAGSAATHPLPISGQVTLGRAEGNDIHIDHPSVSRRHAILHIGPPLRIEDLGSSNGVRVVTSVPSEITSEIVETKVPSRGSLAISTGDGIELGAVTVVVQRARQNEEEIAPVSSKIVRAIPGPVIEDSVMLDLYQRAIRVADSSISVLLLGETGVGKEVMAEATHRHSGRSSGPLVCVNCAAFSESLLENELFGHEAGAFTGALKAKPGLLEMADRGTLFLDEVGDMPISLQVKLLRVVEERKVLRVGGVRPQAIDVRFISATNRDLALEIKRGAFRQDLFFRLSGISFTIPPLRQRTGEIEALARSFLLQAVSQRGARAGPSLSPAALKALRDYPWPGNIRELRNVIERASVLCEGDTITPLHLGLEPMASPSSGPVAPPPSGPVSSRPQALHEEPTEDRVTLPPLTLPLRSRMGEEERKRIIEALDRCAGNQTQAAEMLGISRRTLVSRLNLYSIPGPRKGRRE